MARHTLAAAVIVIGFLPTAASALVNLAYYHQVAGLALGLLMMGTDFAAPLCLRREMSPGVKLAALPFVLMSLVAAYGFYVGQTAHSAAASTLADQRLAAIDAELSALAAENSAAARARVAEAEAALAAAQRQAREDLDAQRQRVASLEAEAHLQQVGGERPNGTFASACPVNPPTPDRCPKAYGARRAAEAARAELAALETSGQAAIDRARDDLTAARQALGSAGADRAARRNKLEAERERLAGAAAGADNEITATARLLGLEPAQLRSAVGLAAALTGVLLGLIAPLIALYYAKRLPPPRRLRPSLAPASFPRSDRAQSEPSSPAAAEPAANQPQMSAPGADVLRLPPRDLTRKEIADMRRRQIIEFTKAGMTEADICAHLDMSRSGVQHAKRRARALGELVVAPISGQAGAEPEPILSQSINQSPHQAGRQAADGFVQAAAGGA